MVSQSIFVLAALVCCLAVTALAQPLDDDAQIMMRSRRAAARRASASFAGYATHTQDAPAYASPEEDEEEVVKPIRNGGRARPSRPSRPQKASEEDEEEEDEGNDGGAPPDYSKLAGKGSTAIATSYSRGKGASSNSHAIAYGGQFSGGNFRHGSGK